jgi:hypothetical protein
VAVARDWTYSLSGRKNHDNYLDRLVGLGGLEPPTSPLSGARSSHLSYRPLKLRLEILTCAAAPHTMPCCRNIWLGFRPILTLRYWRLAARNGTAAAGQCFLRYCTNPTFGVGPPSGASLIGPNCTS